MTVALPELIIVHRDGQFCFSLPAVDPSGFIVYAVPSEESEPLALAFEGESPFEGPVTSNSQMRFKPGVNGIYRYTFAEQPFVYQIEIAEGGTEGAHLNVRDKALFVHVFAVAGQQIQFVKEGFGDQINLFYYPKKIPPSGPLWIGLDAFADNRTAWQIPGDYEGDFGIVAAREGLFPISLEGRESAGPLEVVGNAEADVTIEPPPEPLES